MHIFRESQEGKSDLWLLVWCIDRLRLHKNFRKAYRFWLDKLEDSVGTRESRLKDAFTCWARSKDDRI